MNLFNEAVHNPFYIRLFYAALILLFFLFTKKLLSRFIIRLLSKLKFKNFSLTAQLSDALQRPLSAFFLFTGIYVALGVSPFTKHISFADTPLTLLNTTITAAVIPFGILTTLYTAVIIIICTWATYNLEFIYEEIFSQLNDKLSLTDNTLFIRFSAKIIRFFTIFIGAALVISLFVKDITGILTGVGLGSVAFAFITKDAFSNILSGSLLMVDKPFIIGDWVQVLDIEGIIEDISFRSTRIRTFTQGLVIIPNSKISSENITNWSRMEKRRVKFDLSLAYDTPLTKINTCIDEINKCLASHEAIENETYIVRLESLGAYSLNIQIIYFSLYVDYPRYLQVKESINLQLLDLCAQQGFTIAFPTQTIITQSAAKKAD